MKRSNSIVEEQLQQESGRSFVGKHNLDEQQVMIFVTDLNSLEIVFSNSAVIRYTHSEKGNSFKKKEGDLYSFIHPEDYQDFILHLRSLKNMQPEAVEANTIRLKVNSRTYKKFNFKHRLYSGGTKNKQYLITTAREIRGTGENLRNSFPNPSLEKALLKSLKNNRLLLENMKEGFCLLDILFDSKKNPIDYIFIETNAAFEQQMNVNCVLEKTIKEDFLGYEDQWLHTFERVAVSNESVKFQSFIKNQLFDLHAFPVGEEDDRQVGVLFNQVHQEKHREEKKVEFISITNEAANPEINLKENYKLLKTIFDKTGVGIAVLEPVYEKNGDLVDFTYLKVNDYVLKTQRKNPVGSSYLRMNPDSEETGVFSTFKRTMYNGIIEDIEVKKVLDGHKSWYRVTARRENGLLITTVEDISRQKAKSRRLKENIRFKKQIAKTSPDVIMILNLQEEKVRYINRDMADQPGMRKKDIDGMQMSNIIPFIHPYDRQKAMDFHTSITKAKDKEILDLEFRFKTGENYWEWFNARGKVFMRNKENQVCEYILLLRNMEEQKRTQHALLLAEKLSIKGEVARTLAHELRNPMASIGMAADILSKKTTGEDNAEINNYIGIIKRSTEVLNKLVTDLLTSSNYSPFSPVKCCLAETLEKALRAAGDRIYLVGIKVVKEFSGTYNILADQEKLKIALLNIIVNASEAMNPTEGILTLKITRNKNNYILTITDNGCGMEETQLDKLFDAFYTQKAHGVGIGLSSVKSILEEHHAKILVDSKLNKGTSFHLIFHCYETLERT